MDDKKLVVTGSFTSEELRGREPLEVLENKMRLDGYHFDSINDFDIIFSGIDDNDLRYEVYKKQKKNTDINQELDEIKKIRGAIDISDLEDRERLLNVLSSKLDKLEKEASTSLNVEEYINREIDLITEQLKELEKEVKKEIEEYESFEEEMSKVIKEENEKIDSRILLSSEELDNIKEASFNEKNNINKKSILKKKIIDLQREKITSLKRKKTILENDLEKAKVLDLSLDEYKEITKTLSKRELMNNILINKGLATIVEKPAKERSKEEVKLLKEAKEDILKEISNVQKVDKSISVLEAIEALYNIDVVVKKKEESRKLPIKKEKYEVMVASSKKLPERIVGKSKVNYVPNKAPSDMENVVVNRGLDEKIMIYSNASKYYIKEPLIGRFNLDKNKDIGEIIDFDGKPLFEISKDNYERILNNSNNEMSPYSVEVEDIVLDKDKDIEETSKENEEPVKVGRGLDERIVLYLDSNSNKYYVKRPLISRFNLKDIGEEVSFDGKPLFAISDEDYERIVNNTNNEMSQYGVIVQEAYFPDYVHEFGEPLIDLDDAYSEELIFVYHDTNTNKYYVDKQTALENKLKAIGAGNYKGIDCFEISVDDYYEFRNKMEDNGYSIHLIKTENPVELRIVDENNNFLPVEINPDNSLNNVEDENTSKEQEKTTNEEKPEEEKTTPDNTSEENVVPDDNTQEEKTTLDNTPEENVVPDSNTQEENTNKPSLDSILAKLKGDSSKKKYRASNISVSGQFIEELKNGGYSYNIIHLLGAACKACFKLAKEFFKSKFSKKKEIETVDLENEFLERLKGLNEEEIHVLTVACLNGSLNGKIDANYLDIIKKYTGSKRLDTIEKNLPVMYDKLTDCVGKIEAINNELLNKNISPRKKQLLQELHSKLVKESNEYIKLITDYKEFAIKFIDKDNVLESAKDYPYTSFRCGLILDIDNDKKNDEKMNKKALQEDLKQNRYQDALNHFMSLEKLYSKSSYDISESFNLLLDDVNKKSSPLVLDTMSLLVNNRAFLENANTDLMSNIIGFKDSDHCEYIEEEYGWNDNTLDKDGNNSLLDENSNKLSYILNNYEKGDISNDDCISSINSIKDSAYADTVKIGNECIKILEDYSKKATTYPIDKVRKFIENIISDENNFAFLTQEHDEDLLGDFLANYSSEIAALPKKMLVDIINAALSSSYVASISRALENKYNNTNTNNKTM